MKNVLWVGSFHDPSGYGEASRNYVYNMNGVNLQLKSLKFYKGGTVGLGKEFFNKLNPLMNKDSEDFDIVIFNVTPENYQIINKGKSFHSCMTTFETDGIPKSWVMPIRAMDYVFTYSEFNKNTFYNSGIRNPIFVIPHGVDTDRFSPEKKPLIKKIPNKFVFGSNFDWTPRKNPNALIECYLRAFKGRKDVSLLLKIYAHYEYSNKFTETVKEKIKEIRNFVGNKDSEIMLMPQMINADDMAGFYNSIDCYVSPTRGEGWGLCFSESMGCGVPCIATNWSSHTEFINKDNGYLVDCKIVPVSDEQCAKFPHYAGQNWAEIDKDHLIETMRFVYNNRSDKNMKGINARRDMINKWTWKIACEKMTKIINEIC
ncbi:MAG: glycosyltransferase [Melioribacteraceae bacterium]|nr:glycosyltransferase [Melioribacteraceae bacterium]